ncbi:SH3 domain-containing protein [Aureicoccus marinus]|uniref:SH3b domain-containing protein n=1 Tax=Aureicoccus marinus TaxID=754435 RepID=A0A2S7T5Y6_9FLAO|nr:SH3 domain-containing protein [Aureicoccus marinus]PQJ15333.1 hypothetical protein BST99_05910 [Aureicoccus marinus]
MKHIPSLLLLLVCQLLSAQQFRYVQAESGLVVRDKPSLSSTRLGKLAYGEKVMVLNFTGIQLSILDEGKTIKGEWYQVSGKSQKGYVFSGFLTEDCVFSLATAEKPRWGSLHEERPFLNYLSNHFKTVGKQYDLKYGEFNPNNICGYTQEYEQNITYTISETCTEGGGLIEEIIFPKLRRKHIMEWVEKIHSFSPENPHNIWKEGDSKFEPKEAIPGCYYEIDEQKDATTVRKYCGC